MDSGVECLQEMDDADKQLVKSVKPLLCEIRRQFSESSLRKISYTVFLTYPNDDRRNTVGGEENVRENQEVL